MQIDEEKNMTMEEFFKESMNGGTFEIKTPEGWRQVGKLFNKTRDCKRIKLENGMYLEASKEHLIMTPLGWEEVGDISLGDLVQTESGCFSVISMLDIGVNKTYDLEVCSLSNKYYSNGIVSHNCGKTSLSRIVAAMENCEKGRSLDPCGECDNCKSIFTGKSRDVIELDAASNRGIDDIRSLKQEIRFAPVSGRMKIVIIDEAHSLSAAAAEALLKAIEEPPPYVRFILATTDPHQLIDTIRSRCQVLMFNKISWAELTKHLEFVCNQEKIEFEDSALQMCARGSGGSVRNALQNLQAAVALASGGKLTLDISKKSLGAIDDNLFFHLIDAIGSANAAKCMQVISALFKDGKSATEILDGFLGHLRILLRSLTCKQELSEFGLPEDAAKRYNYQASTVKISVLLNMISLLTDVGRGISLNLDPQIMMEKYVIDSIILVKTNTD